MKVAILATGPSMSQAVAERARTECDAVVVVNAAYQLAPWAQALAAQDRAWWRHNPEARKFVGRKFSSNRIEGVEQIESQHIRTESSSGVLALEVARRLGSTEVELYGFENKGSHYFGEYPDPLRNTVPCRYREFELQLEHLGRDMKKAGIRIVNRTPNTALRCFDRA